MPVELSRLIQDFARPLTRVDWRRGGAFPSSLFWIGVNARYYREITDLAMLAQTAEEFEYMLQDSAVPEWF